MKVQGDEADPFVPGAVVEVVVEDAEMDHYRGDRGTILVRDALGDLHIRWDKGLLDVWRVPDAQGLLRVIGQLQPVSSFGSASQPAAGRVHVVGPMVVVEDLASAAWIPQLLRPFGSGVGSLVPPVFDDYARILHPAYACTQDGDERAVRWSVIAEAKQRLVHPLVQFPHLVGTLRFENGPAAPDCWDAPPAEGTMPHELAVLLGSILGNELGRGGDVVRLGARSGRSSREEDELSRAWPVILGRHQPPSAITADRPLSRSCLVGWTAWRSQPQHSE